MPRQPKTPDLPGDVYNAKRDERGAFIVNTRSGRVIRIPAGTPRTGIDYDRIAWESAVRRNLINHHALLQQHCAKDPAVAAMAVLSSTAPTTPRIVIVMDGGVIQNIFADAPVEVLTVDYDTEGTPDDELCPMPDRVVSTGEPQDYTDKAIADVSQPPLAPKFVAARFGDFATWVSGED